MPIEKHRATILVTMHRQSVVKYRPLHVRHTILAVEQYPLFLPGCQEVRLIRRQEQALIAETSVLNHVTFVTQMHWTDDRVWLKNPFVQGQWVLTPCSDGTQVRLELEIVAVGLWGPVLRTLLPHYLPTMQRAFEARLHQEYAGAGAIEGY